VGIIIFNHGNTDFQVLKKMKIAQLICEKIQYPKICEVSSLKDSLRGSDGFGSTDEITVKKLVMKIKKIKIKNN
jgi:dUTP pyrophosphatase